MASSVEVVNGCSQKRSIDADRESVKKQKGFKDLSSLTVSRILFDNPRGKSIGLVGQFPESQEKAVVILTKSAFTQSELASLCSSATLETDFTNDIYGRYKCYPESRLNSIEATLIYPATEDHIKKYESAATVIVDETPEIYNSVTLEHIQSKGFSLEWVYNILDHKKEVERIVFEDTDLSVGFVLLPDLKWDGKQKETLYLIAIVRQRGLKSLRDLSKDHLPLLKNIYKKGTEAIYDKYKIPKENLRIYLHYQPTFYHLHIHFTYLGFEAPGIFTEKSHLLTTVINNIELVGDYYQRATLPFVLKEGQELFKRLEEKGIVNKAQPILPSEDGSEGSS